MTSRRRRALVVVAVAIVLAWCGWVSGFHRATTPARITWAFSVTAVVVLDVLLWQGRRGRRPGLRVAPAASRWPRPGRPRARALVGVTPWVLLMALVAAWDVLGLDTPQHQAHLTISALTEAFRPLNAAMLLVWMGVGIGYGLTRARAPVGDAAGGEPGPAATRGPAAPHSAGAMVVLGARRPPLALLLPDSRPVGIAFWLGVVAVALFVDQLARRSKGRVANAEELLRFISDPWPAQAVLVLAWGYAGYHLFAH